MTRALVPTPTAPWRTRDEREDSTLPPPLVVESKFTVKRPCWEPRLPSKPVCFLFGAVGDQGVPHRQASGRNYCSHVRGKYHVSP